MKRPRLIASALAAAMLLGVAVVPASAATDDTIADIAIANGSFTTLVAALSCTGLVPAVADPGANLTVFAPTDAAFRKLGLRASNVCKLPKSLLTKISPTTSSVRSCSPRTCFRCARSRCCSRLYTFPSVRRSGAYLNWYAKISATDIDASNGVIHVIDRVLIPYRFW